MQFEQSATETVAGIQRTTFVMPQLGRPHTVCSEGGEASIRPDALLLFWDREDNAVGAGAGPRQLRGLLHFGFHELATILGAALQGGVYGPIDPGSLEAVDGNDV